MKIDIINWIKEFLILSVQDKYKEEFEQEIDKINLARAKVTLITSIIIEMMVITAYCIFKKGSVFEKPGVYYGIMYILLLVTMIVFLVVFSRLGSNISKHAKVIRVVFVAFTIYILIWCALISVLDQLTYGQVIVYIMATVAVSVIPYYKPVTMLLIYLPVHIIFMAFMLRFQKSNYVQYANKLNSSTFLMISLAISYMRYKKQIEDFKNRKIIQEKNEELKRVNKELEEANHKLDILSQTDSLTRVFNRFAFDKAIEAEWNRCKRYSMPLSLIIVDVDFFKAYNDNYGHQAGDVCIRRIAEALSSCLERPTDFVARYGGEEFGVLLPGIEKEEAYLLSERMRKKVEELAIPHEHSAASRWVTISMGVNTAFPSLEPSLEGFIRAADMALYKAKEMRNTTVTV